MIYCCCDRLRREAIEGTALNGIDFIEVLDRDAPTPAERQRTIFVHFVNAPAPALTPDNVRITGGERVRDIRVTTAAVDAADGHVLNVKVDQPGDFSIYALSLQQDQLHPEPPAGIDPVLASVDFSFKAECPSDFDCKSDCFCGQESDLGPEIDYLAKDYASFRRLMLGRLSVLAPQWTERNPADLGVALVELLAFVGDYLSYQQDAVATEAYLGTARRRVSVRRHARLVDYVMHDGCNARAWVQMQVDTDVTKPLPTSPPPIPKGTIFCTGLPDQGPTLTDPALVQKADVVFEAMENTDALFLDHNRIAFYTWSDQECSLPAGSTSATLKGHLPHLRVGEVLVLEEVLGPLTGDAADANPSHRWAVRLTSVQADDATSAPLTDPLNGTQITLVEWATEDALPSPPCISSRTDVAHGERFIEDVSAARGNIVLVDHGRTLPSEYLGTVPQPRIFLPATGDACDRDEPTPVPPRFRPSLANGPLTQVSPLDPVAPASQRLVSDPHAALAAIAIQSELNADTAEWRSRIELLNSDGLDNEFVAEVEVDGIAFIRFGDGQHGRRPETDTEFSATYRVGNGTAGNVGRESIQHILLNESAITGVRNPMPAAGGTEPESMEDVRQRAPAAFRTQERAVTEPDYAEVTQRHPGIQRAAATFRWTGSWHTAFLTVDRLAGATVDEPFERDIRAFVERFRMAGYDLEVDSPQPVSLEVEMLVCAKRDYFRSHVKAALLEVFSNRLLPEGRRGLFHPDNFAFGQTVYLSPLYAAAQAVAGVDSVEIKVFGRRGASDAKWLQDGQILLNRLEIVRLNNDPNFPERGVFKLTVTGGK